MNLHNPLLQFFGGTHCLYILELYIKSNYTNIVITKAGSPQLEFPLL